MKRFAAERLVFIFGMLGFALAVLDASNEPAPTDVPEPSLPALPALDEAAEALAEAGMVADARQLFEALLRVTTDPGRRAVINHALQKLWLQKPQPG